MCACIYMFAIDHRLYGYVLRDGLARTDAEMMCHTYMHSFIVQALHGHELVFVAPVVMRYASLAPQPVLLIYRVVFCKQTEAEMSVFHKRVAL